MKLLEDNIYIEWKEAIAAGVSSNTLGDAKLNQREGWRFTDDSTDKRKVLIHFESMKPQYKALIIAKYGEPKVYLSNSLLLNHLETDYKAIKFFQEYELNTGLGLPRRHIDKYSIAAQWLNLLNKDKSICSKSGLSKEDFYNAASLMIREREIDLPRNYSKLKQKLKKYNKEGYKALISSKFGNTNPEKLSDEGKEWLIAQYSTPLKLSCDIPTLASMYISEAATRGWEPVSKECIYAFLHQEDVESIWYLGRHGWKHWRNRYEYTNKTIAPTFREALWEGDGTKLNFFTHGLQAILKMYFIIDIHSEVILGYDFSTETEDFEVQQRALKNALKFSGHKPYQIKYDHQGGHVGSEAQHFFDTLTQVHFPAKRRSPNSKRIESITGRFQKQVMSKVWYFTGMNVGDTKSLESKPNMEFYHKHSKKLPPLKEIIQKAEECVDMWNNMKHPRYECSRIDQYNRSINPDPQEVTAMDMVDLFYTTTDEMTYYKEGIHPIIKGRKDLWYEVKDENGVPDLTKIQHRFVVKYDADDLSQVMLYKNVQGDLRFVAVATEKDWVPTAVVDYKEGDSARIKRNSALKNQQLQTTEDALADVRSNVGWDEEDLIRAADLAPKSTPVKAHSLYLKKEDDDEVIKFAED